MGLSLIHISAARYLPNPSTAKLKIPPHMMEVHRPTSTRYIALIGTSANPKERPPVALCWSTGRSVSYTHLFHHFITMCVYCDNCVTSVQELCSGYEPYFILFKCVHTIYCLLYTSVGVVMAHVEGRKRVAHITAGVEVHRIFP